MFLRFSKIVAAAKSGDRRRRPGFCARRRSFHKAASGECRSGNGRRGGSAFTLFPAVKTVHCHSARWIARSPAFGAPESQHPRNRLYRISRDVTRFLIQPLREISRRSASMTGSALESDAEDEGHLRSRSRSRMLFAVLHGNLLLPVGSARPKHRAEPGVMTDPPGEMVLVAPGRPCDFVPLNREICNQNGRCLVHRCHLQAGICRVSGRRRRPIVPRHAIRRGRGKRDATVQAHRHGSARHIERRQGRRSQERPGTTGIMQNAVCSPQRVGAERHDAEGCTRERDGREQAPIHFRTSFAAGPVWQATTCHQRGEKSTKRTRDFC
jgi:hypothetical protein